MLPPRELSFVGRRLRTLGLPSLEAYLASDIWARRRRSFRQKKRVEGKDLCLCCDRDHEYDLVVHHRTYERLGAEEDGDLCVLCDDCHRELHKKADEMIAAVLDGSVLHDSLADQFFRFRTNSYGELCLGTGRPRG